MTSDFDELALATTFVNEGPRAPEPGRDSLLGATLDGRYRVMDCLAAGTATMLYRGVQLSIDRAVVIKVLRAERARDPVLMKRLVREAQILTNLSHPNIVGILDSGHTESGELYLVLELIRGTTLEAELARVGRFDVRRACEVVIQLCSALAAAHSVGIVHRNLEPSNIMLLEDPAVRDVVKVLDFGLAKPTLGPPLTVAGAIIGAPRYVAPEALFSSGSADPRSDLYSVGCVMYELLTGRWKQVGSPMPSGVPRTVANLVMALVAKVPEDRPAATFAGHQLQKWLDGNPADRVTTSAVDAETIIDAPLDDDRPLTIERVFPPTPLLAQPIPAIRRVLPPTPLLARPDRVDAWPPEPPRTRVLALTDSRAMHALVLAALLLVLAGAVLVLAVLLR